MYKINFEIKNCSDCPCLRWRQEDCRANYYECGLTDHILCYDNPQGDAIRRWADGKPITCPAIEILEDM